MWAEASCAFSFELKQKEQTCVKNKKEIFYYNSIYLENLEDKIFKSKQAFTK